ncbi:PREDICTED: amyloid protein-binding protein 2 [Cyphomyrmex costatus]|uniref:Amyloid protein-binding protein 2 n=1 Tax=Cyphomyrmex costatus TaxID=456900 RepID=A0A195D495_9HYME|nr:PREDICTED: amyloid protein-binding protein 2 [Cyphomyrmex costatus]KYN07725.1 Amyloid protein-binding protein 2 [Cyphomyrmex costatus]
MADGREPRLFSTRSLYHLCVSAVVDRFRVYKPYLVDLPKSVRFDLYYQLYTERRLCILGAELSDLETFSKMLKVTNRRLQLLKIFQAPMDHKIRIAKHLVISYNMCCFQARESPLPQEIDKLINLGLRLGGFLSDAGWYSESEEVLLACKQLCMDNNQTPKEWNRTLDCCHKLLHAQAAYCDFDGAAETHQLAMEMIEKLKSNQYNNSNHAALFAEFSVIFYIRSEYDEAHRWSMKALKQLRPSLPAGIIVDVLRQAAKSCVVKREFQKADLLIKEAVYLAKEIFDTDHPKYSDVLIDYGFFLLNFDSISNSVTIYKTALDIRRTIFGRTNLHVALAHEDLAYALYVHEYSSGRFDDASEHAGIAIDIMERHLPPNHLMLASARRIKALILEEIAIDNASTPLSEQNLLLKSECLHLSALEMSKTAFGERNVQTAKHYGNLGRLYQSMRKFQEAEMMHLKAIGIKEELLGPDDYEVGLSIGHLASLYNFHMNRYRDAEKLYRRSIAISLKLFGEGYSGLEYDYRGLLHVYNKLEDYEKISEYTDTLNHWKELRDKHAQSEEPPIDVQKRPQPIANVMNVFFSM